MRFPLLLPVLSAMGALLAAQTAPASPVPAVKWRGAVWASAAASDRETADGSLFLRSLDSGEGQLALDGLQIGADVALASGWSLKFTVLAGRDGKVLNASNAQETGSVATPEAMAIWTGGADTVRIGRMWTPMGMEVMDQSQNAMASRGLLFTYALPFAQVGVDWHHAFTPSWSVDLLLFNGEDRVQDNNKSKTAGLMVGYNHGGASDKFITLMAFSGPEQDGLGSAARTGAEGRKRDRACMVGAWTFGTSSLQWEAELGRETFPAAALGMAQGTAKASWSGLGAIYKLQMNDRWAFLARAEALKDDTGVRLGWDGSVLSSLALKDGALGAAGADLRAVSLAAGLERKWGPTFARLEVRQDSLSRDAPDAQGKPFKDARSATFSLGTSF